MPRDEIDEVEDDDLPARPRGGHPGRHGRDHERVGPAGAIVGGAVNAAAMALILAVPSLGLPFVAPAFAAITLPLLAGPAANILSAFIRIGYDGRFTRHLAKLAESAAAAWGLYSLWAHYPFAFAAVGLPAAVDRWLPIGFGVLAVLSGVKALRHLIGLARPDGRRGGRPEP